MDATSSGVFWSNWKNNIFKVNLQSFGCGLCGLCGLHPWPLQTGTVRRTQTLNLLLNSMWAGHRWQIGDPFEHWTKTSGRFLSNAKRAPSGLLLHKLYEPERKKKEEHEINMCFSYAPRVRWIVFCLIMQPLVRMVFLFWNLSLASIALQNFFYFNVRNFRVQKISRISRITPQFAKLNGRENYFPGDTVFRFSWSFFAY